MALAEFIILFREAFEAILIVGIMLTYLAKTKNTSYNKYVWGGVLAGLFLSVVLAFVFQFSEEAFAKNEELFEGMFMVGTALLVTSLIMWVLKQKNISEEIKSGVRITLEKGESFGLFLLSTMAILREGVEVVLFLAGIYITTGGLSLIGASLGVFAAIGLGVLIFRQAAKFDMGLFFKATALVLIIMAAGLFSQGLHELQEAKVLPVWVEHVYDLQIPKTETMGEKGVVGGILKGLTGYDTAPSDLQVVGYLAYLGCAYLYYTKKAK